MNKIYSLLATLIAFTWLTACGPDKDKIRFEGQLDNINDAEFYILSEDGAFSGIDTVKITDGKFTYERNLSTPAVLTLLYPNFTQTYIVAEPGQTVKMKGDAAKIGEAKISGTEQNELLSDFRLKHATDIATNQRLAAMQFVTDNSHTLAAVAVFLKYFAKKQETDPRIALQMLDILKKAQPKERAVAYLNQHYRPFFLNGKGQLLPSFTAHTLDGRKLSSADFRGRNLVIACMASWQSDSRQLLRSLHHKLKTMPGKWQCLVLSLDTDLSMLRSELRIDSLTSAPVICDQQAFQSSLFTTLGIHYVPSLMLVNAQGRILQRDITKIEDAQL